jgi:hypothetical protein
MQVIKGLVMPTATHFTCSSVEDALESWLKQTAICQTRNLLEKRSIRRYQNAGYIVKAGVLNLCFGRLQRRESSPYQSCSNGGSEFHDGKKIPWP